MRRVVAWLMVLWMLLACCPAGAEGGAEEACTVAERYGVTVRVSCQEEPVFPGETVVFTVEAANHSGAALGSLRLTEISIGGGTWSGVPQSLPSEGTMTARYTVRMPDALHDIALFQLQWDGNAMSLQHEVEVLEPAAFTLTAEGGEWPWKAGEEHLIDFTLVNEDARVLENVTLTLPGAYQGADRTGEVRFLRKDRRKLKTAQQTDTFLVESLAPGESVTLTAAWTPDAITEEEVRVSLQAALTLNGRRQTRAATFVCQQEIVRHSMWTAMLPGGVSVGHALCALGALTLLAALLAVIRARRLR